MNPAAPRQSNNILASSALCMALQMTGFVMVIPLFARRFEELGAGVEALGMSAMAYALASTITAPFAGALADRFGRRPIILLSLGGYVVTFAGYLLAGAAWQLIALRGLAGVFTAGLLPAMTGMIGDLAPHDRRGQWIGVLNGGASAGWIAGPLLGGALYDRYGYSVALSISIVMAVAALLLAIVRLPETHRPATSARIRGNSWRANLEGVPGRGAFVMLMVIAFGVMFAWAFIEPKFMFYAYDDLGWSSSQLGLVMSTYGLSFMVGEFTLGRLSDRLGRKPVLVLGLALFAAQFIGLVIFREAAWIVVSFILAGLGNALFDPALSAMILDIAPPERTAGMIGLKSTAGALGNLLGPGLVVLLTPVAGPLAVFSIAAAIVGALALTAALAMHLPSGKESGQIAAEGVLEH